MSKQASARLGAERVVYDDQVAALYDHDSHGIYRASHDDMLAMLPHDQTYAHILDVGAGTGAVLRRLSERFAPTTLFALDPSPAMLARASEKVPSIVPVLGDDSALITDLRLRDLDLVVANFVLAYSPPEQLIARIHTTLRPGGIVAITTTTMNSFQEFLRIAQHPIFRVISSGYAISPETIEANLPPVPKSAAALSERLVEGGFEVLDVKTRTHPLRFKSGRALYDFGLEGGWWLDLYQRLALTSRSVPWMHVAMRVCQLIGLLDWQCTTSMETCSVIARRTTREG